MTSKGQKLRQLKAAPITSQLPVNTMFWLYLQPFGRNLKLHLRVFVLSGATLHSGSSEPFLPMPRVDSRPRYATSKCLLLSSYIYVCHERALQLNDARYAYSFFN